MQEDLNIFQEISNDELRAEKNFYERDYNLCLFLIGRICEHITAEICRKNNLNVTENISLNIELLFKNNIIDQHIKDLLHKIREVKNASGHCYYSSELTCRLLLAFIKEFHKWFTENYSNHGGEFDKKIIESQIFKDVSENITPPENTSNEDNRNKNKFLELCKTGNVQAIKEAINSGENINQQDQNGFSPLMKAAQYNDHQVINFLLAKGANIKLKNKNGLTAYDYAKNNAKLNKTKLMKKLEV